MKVDKVKLDTAKARSFFERYGVKLKLTTAYNLEANGKSKRSHDQSYMH